MSDESSKNTIDIDQFQRQIGNLRCAVTILVITISFLLGYIILEPFLQYMYVALYAPLMIFLILVLGLLLLTACLSANDKS